MEKNSLLNWEEKWPNLLGFYPCLAEDGGNYTTVMLAHGEQVVERRKTKTVLANLAGLFALDVGLVKARGRKVLKSRREVPLALLPELVLLPVKRREAPMKDAGTIGYVVMAQVAGWEEAPEPPYRTRIFFQEGSFLDVLTTPVTFRKKMADGELVLKDYHRRHHAPLGRPGYPVGYGWPPEDGFCYRFREKFPGRFY